MGVTWVFEAEQTAKSIERILETIGGELRGTYQVDVIPYNPPPQCEYPANIVMHHSKNPQSTFSICPKDMNFKKSPKAVCDRGFDLILGKLSGGFVMDTAGKIEINGNEYNVHTDWTVRVGTATQGTAVKGVIVEVEYDPSVIVVQCREMMVEFIKHVFDKYHDNLPEIFVITDKLEKYTPLDTMWQYLVMCAKLRKKT
ncbi:CBN-MDT-20 protein [Caenorhabditis brenneri]|uniref:Mediator of RNA polymerase II transcription subunit 20 n=1 Tax=Caenorhabditis brenneri TaxID=135651 RepID=G0N015_CAEBE|nr:CBN-MDT-20 protein [Caenorhabditis brenneri]